VDEDCAGNGIELKQQVHVSEDDDVAAEDAAHAPLDMLYVQRAR
jgi:hypothetical protein